jgi:hypothetical protein
VKIILVCGNRGRWKERMKVLETTRRNQCKRFFAARKTKVKI